MNKLIFTLTLLLQFGFNYAQLAIDTNQLFMDSIYSYVGVDTTIKESRIEANIYPIRYHDGLDVHVEFRENKHGIFVKYKNQETEETFEDYIPPAELQFNFTKLPLSHNYNFWFDEVTANQMVAYQKEPHAVTSQFSDMIVLSLDLYQQMAYWTKHQKEMSMRDKIFYLRETGVAENVLISYTQQFFHETNFSLNREKSFEEKINSLFNNSKRGDEEMENQCDCAYLTHNAMFAPGDYHVATAVNSPFVNIHSSYTPKYHLRHTIAEGPAHYKALFMRGKNGGMAYETSTLGATTGADFTMSPSFVKQSYNLVCIGNMESPRCECTKIIGIDKLYAAQLTAYAPDMKFTWSDGSQAAVEEFAALIVNNEEFGVRVIDAGRARVRDACETTWNPEWFQNLFDLAGDVLGVVISLQTDTSGLDSLITFSDNISQVGESLINLVSTPFVNVTGTCTPVTKSANLLAGKQFWILKSNQPTDIILASYTYLGSRGYGSWNTRAISESGYSLATVLQSRNGFKPGVNDCCTDRVGHWNAAAVTKRPLSESNYVNHSESYLGLFGPWNNIQYDALGNPIFLGNGGYFVYDDINQDNCAETIPKPGKTDGDSYANTADIAEFEFSLAPNPTNNYLNISILSNNNTNLDVSLYSINGEKLETIYYGKTNGLHQIQWESKSGEMASGSYFIIVTDQESNKEVKQFIYKNN